MSKSCNFLPIGLHFNNVHHKKNHYYTPIGQGWSEPVATIALVWDEAIQDILGMNQKHILFPYPRFFQFFSLPQSFPLLPTSPHFALIPLLETWNLKWELETRWQKWGPRTCTWSERAKVEGKKWELEVGAWSKREKTRG